MPLFIFLFNLLSSSQKARLSSIFQSCLYFKILSSPGTSICELQAKPLRGKFLNNYHFKVSGNSKLLCKQVRRSHSKNLQAHHFIEDSHGASLALGCQTEIFQTQTSLLRKPVVFPSYLEFSSTEFFRYIFISFVMTYVLFKVCRVYKDFTN